MIMNAFQTCHNTTDAVPLYLPQQLYLKPIARLTISVQLPNMKKLGKSISHWEMMERFREIIKPDEFAILKVTKTTVEFVRFEAELEHKSRLDKVISKLDNRTIKLKDIPDLLRVRSAEAKSEFPTRGAWDNFFQEAKDMNEMKPGERPDTIHISNLPIKWFIPYSHQSSSDDLLPSERIFHKIFEKFGHIRYVDIPKCDPYRDKMKDSISGIKTIAFEDKEFFEGYVQFKDYIGFNKAMDYLRGMKLMHKEDDEVLVVNIKVDFDRSKHLSDASIRRREIVRERLIKKQRDKEEKEKQELEDKKRKEESERQKQIDIKLQKQQRRRIREEKRKAKILEKLKISGADEINEKIAREEKKLLKVQRKLEAIRLVEELFRRINEKLKDEDNIGPPSGPNRQSYNELQRYKNTSELEVLNQREVLHNAIKGRVMLKTMLSGASKRRSSSSDSEDSAQVKKNKHLNNQMNNVPPMYDPNWYGYPYHMPPVYPPPVRGHPSVPSYVPYTPRGRGFYKNPFAGPSRGFRNSRGFSPRYRGNFRKFQQHYPPELEEEYMKYFSKFLHEHDIRENRTTRSRSRSRSSSYGSRRSRSKRRSYSRSRSRSRSRYRSRSKSHSSRRRHSRSSRKSRSHTPSARRKSRSPTPSSSRRKSRSPTPSSSRRKSRSRTPSSSKRKSRSRQRSKEKSRSASVDSSKFVSPSRMRNARSRSWSMPRSSAKEDKRWSKSPEQEN